MRRTPEVGLPQAASSAVLISAFGILFAALLLAGSPTARADLQSSAAATEFFEKQVRPLLADQCFGCHGPGAAAANGGLKMLGRAELLKGGGRGPAIVPAHPEQSLLIHAVSYTDNSLAMPPRARLTDPQIAVLTEWIRRGAVWPSSGKAAGAATPQPRVFNLSARKASHWAWQPVKRPNVPPVKDRVWAANPIDAFILSGLESKGISPAKPADRRTLIRRVTFDLIGLPPTPAEVDAFLADRSPGAYAKVVDRLLASPHYGERWARHWLDLVRYAETDGHEFDLEKPGAYQYRDYVIRAFNADVNYRQFALEQLAGDLLPSPRLNPVDGYNESILGTGFLWLGAGTHSPVDLMDDQADHMDNEIDVLSKTFLGIGVACARCHDHKFDAVSQKDYYGLFGILRSTRRQLVGVGPQPDHAVLKSLSDLHGEIDQTLIENARAPFAADAWLQDPAVKKAIESAKNEPGNVLYPLAALAGVQPERFASQKLDLLTRMRDQQMKAEKASAGIEWFAGPGVSKPPGWTSSGLAFGAVIGNRTTVDARLSGGTLPHVTTAFCASVADSGTVSDRLPGTVMSRTFTITQPHILYRMAGHGARLRLVVDGLLQLRDPLYGGLAIEPDSESMKWYEQDLSRWIGHRAYVELQDADTGYIAVDRIGFSSNGAPPQEPNALVLDMIDKPGVNSQDTLNAAYRSLLLSVLSSDAGALRAGGRMSEELRAWAIRTTPISQDREPRLASLEKQVSTMEDKIAVMQPAMAASDGTGENERIHMRGNYRTPGAEAPRRFLEACDGTQTFANAPGSGRLQLAERITAASDPLFARVMVNRLWQHHFGVGIVATPDDFGFMGARPTNPQLLDWLASEFVRRNWSIKQMQRVMVLSNSYQMDSRSTAKADAADPQNELLHRMTVRRLEAECIRDAILSASGRLDPTVCGPPVMPHLSEYTPGRGAPPSGPLDGAGRRSIYISVRRGFPVPMLAAFDLPVPMTTMGRRTVSNVPAQALALLNDPFVVDQAGVWAKRILSTPGTLDQRISAMYETAFSRPPDPLELAAARNFMSSRSSRNSDDLPAWSDLCHVLFNVKEFIFLR